MKTLPSFLKMCGFLLVVTNCHSANAAGSATESPRLINSPSAQGSNILESPLMLAIEAVKTRCLATGNFNLGANRDHLMMEVRCSDGETKLLRTPRLTDKPNIFKVPFELSVVSIMGEDRGDIRIHLHYYNSEHDDVQHIVSLHPRNGEELTYSFEGLVGDKIAAIPLEKE